MSATKPTDYVKTKANRRRIKQGKQAALAGAGDYFDPTDLPSSITDALTNLMHYAEQIGADFDTQLRKARDHYTCERTGNE